MDVPVICRDKEAVVIASPRHGPPRSWHHVPLSMASNSFSSPVMRGMRVQGVLVLVATAYTWGLKGVTHVGFLGEGCWGKGADLGLHMVSHVVSRAAQRDLPDGPRSIVGQVGGQDADPQLTLGRMETVRSGDTGLPGVLPGQGHRVCGRSGRAAALVVSLLGFYR